MAKRLLSREDHPSGCVTGYTIEHGKRKQIIKPCDVSCPFYRWTLSELRSPS
jgi:hypothetical protein